MLFLIAGLILFLAPHSVAIVSPQWRKDKIASTGAGVYAGAHSFLSLLGLGLIVWGYGLTRIDPVFIWNPPAAMNHITSLLVLIALIMMTAAFIPRNHLKKIIGHPMILSVKIWAFAHLLANGRLGDIVLFGAFLVWAILLFIALRKEDRKTPPAQITPTVTGSLTSIVVGTGIWLVLALWLHLLVIGVAPFGIAST